MKLILSIFIVLSIILATFAFSIKKKSAKNIGRIMLILPILLVCFSKYNLILALAIGFASGIISLLLLRLKSGSRKTYFKLTYSIGLLFTTIVLLACGLVYFAITKQIILLLIFAFTLPVFAFTLLALVRREIAKNHPTR